MSAKNTPIRSSDSDVSSSIGIHGTSLCTTHIHDHTHTHVHIHCNGRHICISTEMKIMARCGHVSTVVYALRCTRVTSQYAANMLYTAAAYKQYIHMLLHVY
jgi:hypothetical protein